MGGFAGIILARSSSTRLPNKVHLELAGKSVLRHVIERLRSSIVNEIIVATSKAPEDDRIEQVARSMKVKVFRGSLNDVLDRFTQALKSVGGEHAVRVNCGKLSHQHRRRLQL